MQPFAFQDFTSCHWERLSFFVLIHKVFLAKSLSIHPWIPGSFARALNGHILVDTIHLN
jgi:hypothetical protein